MSINVKNSSCMRIGNRCNVRPTCASIMTCHGQPLQWVPQFRYLDVFIISSRSFKCSLMHAKRSFYAAVNNLFVKLLNVASDEVILELVRAKCIPDFIIWFRVFSVGQGRPAVLKPRLHDTTCCQTGCPTGLTTG